MVNLRRQPVSYRQFQGQAILADGLLAVSRPGGEVEQALANALFGASRVFGERAEQVAGKRGRDAAAEAALGLEGQRVKVTGGQVSGGQVSGVNAGDVQPGLSAPSPSRAPLPKQGKVSPVVNLIATAAARHGVPAQALIRVAEIESRMNPGAKNPTSSAGGLFQQTDGNAAQYGVANRFDAAQSADGAARFMRDNTRYLRRVLGRDPTVGELYLAHQQGPAGAARLLSNPDALASNLVGRDAVRLNGGDPDTTTAAAFASKWVSKAGSQPVTGDLTPVVARVPLDGSVDPSRFTVTRTPVEIEVTGGEPPVLTGRDTIFGRAYDEVLTRHYQAQLDDAMLSGTAAVYEKLKDDPEALAVALSDLKAKQLNEHVPPEVRLDYEQAFSRQEQGYLRRAQAARETRIEQDQLAGWQLKDAEIREGLSRAEAGLDLSDEASLERIAGEGRRLKDHLSEGVARGWVSLPRAREMAENVDADVAAAFYLKQAEGLRPGEVEDLRDQLRRDYAAGKLQGINAAGWRKLETGLNQREAKAHSDFASEREALERKLADDLASIGLAGKELAIDPAQVEELLGPKRLADWKASREVAKRAHSATSGMERLTPQQLASRVDAQKPEPGEEGFAVKQAAYEAAAKRATDLMTQRRDDPASAVDTAFPEVRQAAEAFDPAKPETLTQLVAARNGAQAAIGIPHAERRYLTKNEAKAIGAVMDQSPEAAMTWAQVLMRSAPQEAENILGQIADDAPGLAVAADLILRGGTPDALAYLAQQRQIERQQGYKEPKRDPDKERERIAEVYGGAFATLPGRLASVQANASRIFFAMARERGIAPDLASEDGKALYDTALQVAAGASYRGGQQYGGITEVNGARTLVPVNMPASDLEAIIKGIADRDLSALPPIRSANAVPVRAADLQGARLVAVRDGIYRVAIGDPATGDPRFVMSGDDFWLLDARQLREIQLRRPVPGRPNPRMSPAPGGRMRQ